jgi:hypothetical protein
MKGFAVTLMICLSFAGIAHAGTAVGVVKAYDGTVRSVTLEDGTSYILADGLKVDGLKPGVKVTVTFDDGTTNASAVEVVQ